MVGEEGTVREAPGARWQEALLAVAGTLALALR